MAKRAAAARRPAKRSSTVKRAKARETARKSTRGSSSRGSKKRAAGLQDRAPAKRTTLRKAARRKTAARAAATRSASRTRKPRPSRLAAAATLVRGAAAAAVVALAERLPWAQDENDPIVLLEADHRRFEQLLKEGEETTERAVMGRTRLLEMLTAELNVHELLEERLLYPALKAHPEARDIVLEGFQEHHVADLIVRELHELARDDERWGAKFKVLKENITHHIEEEESEMFRTARAVLSREELNDLGTQMKALRNELGA